MSTKSTKANLIRRVFGTKESASPVEAPRSRPFPAQHTPRWDEGIPPRDLPSTKPREEPTITLAGSTRA